MMMEGNSARRKFLKFTSAGLAGAATGAVIRPAHGMPSGAASVHYDVRAFGAKGDGKTLDTPAVNKAIEVAAAAGGGIVRFSAGAYLCYSVHLKSNIVLLLDPGATIVAASPAQGGGGGYDPPEPNSWDKFQDF